jgi:cysteine desulfurase
MTRQYYLDAAATTPLAPSVLEVMLPLLGEPHGNASSAHWAGRRSQLVVAEAREQVAELMATGSAAVIFTSGATESNNLALFGMVGSAISDRRELVTVATEHPSVLRTMRALEARGHPLHVLRVDEHGQVDQEQLSAVVTHRTLLVSVQAANNETGVIQDIRAIGDLVHARGATLHVDASQLMGWGQLPNDWDCDLTTISGHKMHGPQGVGGLIIARSLRQKLQPAQYGGGQESGLRSGTINVPGVAGLGAAAKLASDSGKDAARVVEAMRGELGRQLLNALPGARDNAERAVRRLPGILNVSLSSEGQNIDADAVLAQMPTVAASTGSACSSGVPGPSPVLLAMGFSQERAASSLRMSLSRMSTQQEVDAVVPLVIDAVRTVGALSEDASLQTQEKVVSA